MVQESLSIFSDLPALAKVNVQVHLVEAAKTAFTSLLTACMSLPAADSVCFEAHGKYPATKQWVGGLSKSVYMTHDTANDVYKTNCGETLTKMTLEKGFLSLVETVLCSGKLAFQEVRSCPVVSFHDPQTLKNPKRIMTYIQTYKMQEMHCVDACSLTIDGGAAEILEMLEGSESLFGTALCKEFKVRITHPKRRAPIDMKACGSLALLRSRVEARRLVDDGKTRARVRVVVARAPIIECIDRVSQLKALYML